MITGNGQNVKIIDFGLSDADSYFSFKAPAGTKAYASPELVVGERIDARSDIWALGVIINELSGSYRHISANCLRRDKDKRYHSAAEVKRAIIKEPARKIKNSIAASAVIITIIAGIWMIYEGHGSSIPATDADIPSADEAEAADYVMQHAQPGDLVITLGCGHILTDSSHNSVRCHRKQDCTGNKSGGAKALTDKNR